MKSKIIISAVLALSFLSLSSFADQRCKVEILNRTPQTYNARVSFNGINFGGLAAGNANVPGRFADVSSFHPFKRDGGGKVFVRIGTGYQDQYFEKILQGVCDGNWNVIFIELVDEENPNGPVRISGPYAFKKRIDYDDIATR